MISFFKRNTPECNKYFRQYKKPGRYQFIRDLGEGGLASVASCFDKLLNRIVAIKKLKAKNMSNPHLVRSFLNEVKLLSYLDHPGVVPIYESFIKNDNQLCYSMKIIEGERLTKILESRPEYENTPGEWTNKFLGIFKKLCETLAYVHDMGIIHLDVKPDNILIGKYGEVMLLDWGNARLFDKAPYQEYFKRYMKNKWQVYITPEDNNMILGTPNYMSPEQTNCDRESLTPSSDIFSAGIILYIMITGKHPFPEIEDTQLILAQIRNLKPRPVFKINKEVPLRLSMICEKMLEKDPLFRYHNFNEVMDDFDEFYNSGQAFATKSFKPGEIICKEHEIGEYAFKIISGKVRVFKTVQEKQTTLAILGKGEMVGELAVFSRQPRSATIIVLEPTVIQIMDKESVNTELEKLSPWVGKMISSLSSRFIDLNNKMVSLDMKEPKKDK